MPQYRLVSFAGDQTFELPTGRSVVVGRGVLSDLAVYDPTISRIHAELTVSDEGVDVRDLDSSNGTCINGARVSMGRLAPGDSVTFGKVVFQLREAGRVEAAPPDLPPGAGLSPGGEIIRQLAVEPPGAAPTTGGAEKKLGLLLTVSQKLSGELDLDRLLGLIAETILELMDVDRVQILLRQDGSGELVPRVFRARHDDTPRQQVPRSIANKAVNERIAVLTQDAAADARFKGRSIVLQQVRSAMCSPLMAAAEEVLGVLYVDNLSDAHAFSDEDLRFLVAFSGIAAIAIKNSQYSERIHHETQIRSNFERYVAPHVAADIARRTDAVRPGGDKRPVVVLFADIRGFTAMSETMAPDAIAELLSDYFSEMVEVVFEHGGTLDKFIGDALMALWGAPIAHDDDPDRALQAAFAMQNAIARLNERWIAAGRPAVAVGMGLNAGEAFAGNVGSQRRLEYTVLGDPINVAARLCANARGGEILVSGEFLARLREPAPAERLSELTLKGKVKAVEVFRLSHAGGAP
jgi:adenylate cyclase